MSFVRFCIFRSVILVFHLIYFVEIVTDALINGGKALRKQVNLAKKKLCEHFSFIRPCMGKILFNLTRLIFKLLTLLYETLQKN